LTENFHKWYSQWIGEDFKMLVFGEKGIPLILFPQKFTNYYDYKDFGVVESLGNLIDDGIIKVYCPDSYDSKIWFDFKLTPEERIEKYQKFEQVILHDIVGFANYETEEDKLIFGGFGFGAYYALNTVLKYPDLAKGLITIGGEFDIKQNIHGHFDEQAYYNSPLDYLFGLSDSRYMNQYKKINIILACGASDDSFEQNKYISKLLFEKNVNHLFDVYPFKINTYDDCKLTLNNNINYLIQE
jgi:esterase/lipase superfamily enzyme